MKVSTTKSKLNKIIFVAVSVVFWTALWALAAKKIDSVLLLPSPHTVFSRLCSLLTTSEFRYSVMMSLLRVLLGYIIGVAAGTILAVLTSSLKFTDTMLSPLGAMIRTTPVASFIMLAWLWLDNAEVPIFITALMVTPIVWNNLKTAISQTDRQLLELASAYKFGVVKTINTIYIPSVIPSYASSLATSLGLGWKAGIAAEVLCQPPLSIGTGIYQSKIYLEIPDMFAWTLTVIILSIIMEIIFMSLISHFLPEAKTK